MRFRFHEFHGYLADIIARHLDKFRLCNVFNRRYEAQILLVNLFCFLEVLDRKADVVYFFYLHFLSRLLFSSSAFSILSGVMGNS